MHPADSAPEPQEPTTPTPNDGASEKQIAAPASGRGGRRWIAELAILAVFVALGVAGYLYIVQSDAEQARAAQAAQDEAAAKKKKAGGGRKAFGVDATLARLDKNKDEKISPEEAGQAWDFLKNADTDKDGAITRKELEAAPKSGKKGGFKKKGGGKGPKDATGAARTAGAARAIFPVKMVRIADDAEVIGVTFNGVDRAYLLKALQGDVPQVIHDIMGDTFIVVTYCERSGRVRAFYGNKGKETPLDVMFAGHDPGKENGGLLLRTGGKVYSQETGKPVEKGDDTPFPYAEVPVERTTWKEWREAHPQTHVYVGRIRDDPDLAQVLYPEKGSSVSDLMRTGVYLLPFLPAALMLLYLLVKLAFTLLRRGPAPKPA